MPLDGISTRCLSTELSAALSDARVDRIYQPDRHDILFILRREHENLRLIVSANPSAPRLHLTTENRENPSMPPMFCMLLRKHLLGARITSVSSPGSERIIEITFLTQNELGDKVEKILVAELMGRHSNIIFLNQDRRIHDSIVHVDAEISRVREVMPARPYVYPPDQGKRNLEEAIALLDKAGLEHVPVNQAQVDQAPAQAQTDQAPAQAPTQAQADQAHLLQIAFFPLSLHQKGIEKALLDLMGGFSPALCHEIAYQAGIDGRRSLLQLNSQELRLLLLALRQVIRQALNGQFRPTAFFLQPQDAVPVDFHAFSLSDYAYRRAMPSLSAAMDLFYLEKSRQNALIQKKASLARQISNQLEQARKRLIIHEADLRESQNKDEYKANGDLILSWLHVIRDGQNRLSLTGEQTMDGQARDIELDPSRSAAQNAQRYYKLYAKARNRAAMSARFLEADREEIEWLESLENALAAAEETADITAIREELTVSNLAQRRNGPMSGIESVGSGGGNGSGSGRVAGGSSGGASQAPAKGFEPGRPSSRKKSAGQIRQEQKTGVNVGKGANGGKGDNAGFAGKGGVHGKSGKSGKGSKSPAPLPPRRFVSSDGFQILVGRNNLQNDQLTLKQAHKNDTWLHVQRMPGTHVIISNGNQPVPQRTLLEAAETAAYFSRASIAGEGAKVAVDYCPVSHVRKPSGARPGKVIYDRYQTLVVQPKDPKHLPGPL